MIDERRRPPITFQQGIFYCQVHVERLIWSSRDVTKPHDSVKRTALLHDIDPPTYIFLLRPPIGDG
jgi:hypothetical protein